jgi:hypothetical protein
MMKAVAGIRAATDPGEIIVSSQDESPRINQIEVPQIRRYTLASLAAAGVAGALGVLRARFQHSHMFTPTRYPEGEWDPARQGLVYRDVWFDSEPGVRLHGWWIEHGAPRATVLYCHGNAGSLGSRVEIFRYFQRLKVNVFAFDYRGYGRSTAAAPSEQGLYRDARAAYACLTGELGVAPREILLFGHSMGGAVAVDAALDCPVSGLIVQSSFTDLRDMARHAFPGVPMHWITRNCFRSIAKVGRLGMPKLFVHGRADTVVPYVLGERLYAAAAAPKSRFAVPGADHNDLHLQGKAVPYFQVLARFRRRCVG